MARYRQRGKRNPAGSAPGLIVASADAVVTSMKAIAFGSDSFEEIDSCGLDQALTLRGKFSTIWLDITGLADVALIGRLGEVFGLSTLALEDVVRPGRFSSSAAHWKSTIPPLEPGSSSPFRYESYLAA